MAYHTLALPADSMSRSFHPCMIVPPIHVSQFPTLHFCAAEFFLAISCLAVSESPIEYDTGKRVQKTITLRHFLSNVH